MFSYIRYFSLISLVVVIFVATGIGYYFRVTATNDLRMFVEKGNISLTQGYVNTIWRRYTPLFQYLEKVDMKLWPKDHLFVEFSRETFRFFEGIPVGKVTFYTTDKRRFLSTDQSEIIMFKESAALRGIIGGGSESEGFTKAMKGEVYSRVIAEGSFKGPDGSLKRGTLVQTIIPIMPENYVPVVLGSNRKTEAVIEIFYDVTQQAERLAMFQFIGTAGILTVFVVLLAALFITSMRAEHLIARKHEENLELESAKARAEAASEQKSMFLANISHELRTPLNAIIGFSEMMRNETFGPLGGNQYKDYARDIHSSGEHLLSLINDILDYSKAESGKLEIEVAPVDLTKLVKSSLRFVSPRAEHAVVKLSDSLPEERIVLKTDAKRLKQILLNLLSNAVKFTHAGGEVRLTVMPGLDGKSAVIIVKDTGIGMEKKDIAKAMAVFGQVDSRLARKYEGTGLGLPLTRKLVTLLGGTFEIESEPNIGTQVTIILPLELPSPDNTDEATDTITD